MKHSENNQSNPKKKYYIPVDGIYYETTKEIYVIYYRMERRERYLQELDLKKGVVNFTDINNPYYTAEEILKDKNTNIEDEVINKIYMKLVFEAIKMLNVKEKWLIQELFFYGKSQRQLSKETGIPLMTISNRKRKIIDKLRKHMKI